MKQDVVIRPPDYSIDKNVVEWYCHPTEFKSWGIVPTGDGYFYALPTFEAFLNAKNPTARSHDTLLLTVSRAEFFRLLEEFLEEKPTRREINGGRHKGYFLSYEKELKLLDYLDTYINLDFMRS